MAWILLFLALLLMGCVLLMRFSLPGFGKKATLVCMGLCFLLLLALGIPRIHSPFQQYMKTPFYGTFVRLPANMLVVALLMVLGSAPAWVFLGRWAKRSKDKKTRSEISTESLTNPIEEKKTGPSRRQVLSAMAWSIPSLSLATAGYGTFVGAQSLVTRRIRLFVPSLPKSLEGFRIGHITDAHISPDFTQIKTLETACKQLSYEQLDLLVTTGDLCDHRPQFAEVVHLLSQVHTRLGHYACLGNHEMYVGIDQVRKDHERSNLQLLENTHTRLGDLRIAGINYPSEQTPQMKANPKVAAQFLQKALPVGQSAPFTLLLSHHPHVIKQAQHHSVDLILSGHLHGGQISFTKRSVLEPFYGYTKGLYQIDNPNTNSKMSQLFVSNGFGHWLPFRIGCPPEMVVIELSSKQTTDSENV